MISVLIFGFLWWPSSHITETQGTAIYYVYSDHWFLKNRTWICCWCQCGYSFVFACALDVKGQYTLCFYRTQVSNQCKKLHLVAKIVTQAWWPIFANNGWGFIWWQNFLFPNGKDSIAWVPGSVAPLAMFLSCDRGDCLVGCLGEANLGGPLGIMSLSLNCRHIIATLRFQLNFQGAFFPGRGRVGGGVGVKGVLREPGQGATASISQPDGEGCERSFKWFTCWTHRFTHTLCAMHNAHCACIN